MDEPVPGRIVVLDGAPRSGEASIAAAMQGSPDGTWMALGVDAAMARVPPRLRPGIGLRPGAATVGRALRGGRARPSAFERLASMQPVEDVPRRTQPKVHRLAGSGAISGHGRVALVSNVTLVANASHVRAMPEKTPVTMPALAEGIGGRLPFSDERAAANQLRRILAAQTGDETKLRVFDEEERPVEITLTPGLSQPLMEVLRYVGKGDAVTLVPVSRMLTTQQAADILDVSRPFLISLLDEEETEFTPVGRHRRIEAEALFACKEARDAKRSDALTELAELDAGQF